MNIRNIETVYSGNLDNSKACICYQTHTHTHTHIYETRAMPVCLSVCLSVLLSRILAWTNDKLRMTVLIKPAAPVTDGGTPSLRPPAHNNG
jgi:hypothetical protein